METRLPASETETVQRCFKKKHADEQFYALAETLLWRNQAVSALLDGVNGPAEGPNENQVAFATVAMLDLQVPNGGIMQFFWNCPGWVDFVSASLLAMGLPDLSNAFAEALADLVGKIGTYSEFRKRNSLQVYSECASEFDFDTFDSAYFSHGEDVYVKSVGFVSQHLADFVG